MISFSNEYDGKEKIEMVPLDAERGWDSLGTYSLDAGMTESILPKGLIHINTCWPTR